MVNATGGYFDAAISGTVSITDAARILAGGAYPGKPTELSAYIADHSARYVYIDTQIHTYTYTVSGTTLIATCSEEECRLTDHKLTLTLTKNGFNRTELNLWVREGAAEPVINYYKADDLTNPIAKPGLTDYGKFTVVATVGTGGNSATATVDFEQYPYNYTGDGQSPETAYEIYTVFQLEDLAHAVNGTAPYESPNNMQGVYFKLTADIGTAAEPVTTVIGSDRLSFAGHFDGAGHTVTLNLGGVDAAAELANLGIDGRALEELTRMLEMGEMDPFMLREYLPEGVSIDDVLAIIAQGPQSHSGMFGYLGSGGEIKNVTTADSVNGTACVGGVCGYNTGGTIIHCTNVGSVDGNVSGASGYGGVCGWNGGGTIANCYNIGSVSGDKAVGGVCGNNFAAITNCYNAGSVSGNANVGGVCGYATLFGFSSPVFSCIRERRLSFVFPSISIARRTSVISKRMPRSFISWSMAYSSQRNSGTGNFASFVLIPSSTSTSRLL